MIRKVEEGKVELKMEGDPGLLGLLSLNQSMRHLVPRPNLQLFVVSFLTPICVSGLGNNLNGIHNSCHLASVSYVLGATWSSLHAYSYMTLLERQRGTCTL